MYDYRNILDSRTASQRIISRNSIGENSVQHVVIDAGFSGAENYNQIMNFGANFTASVNISHKQHVYQALAKFCQPNSCLAGEDKQGIIWSLKREDDGSHFLATTAFQGRNDSERPHYD